MSGVFGFSVNVGYNTVTVPAGGNVALGLQFEDVTLGSSIRISISNLVTVATPASNASWGNSMDQIWRWDTTRNNWQRYGFQKPRGGVASWKAYDNSAKTFSALTEDDSLTVGDTFLFFRGGSASTTITLSGGVKQFSAQKGYVVPAGGNVFMAYPWPVPFAISDITQYYDNCTPASNASWGNSMDQIWRWDTTRNNWQRYGYQKPRGGTATWKAYDNSAKTFSALTENDVVPAGQGFLFFRGGSAAATITFTYAAE